LSSRYALRAFVEFKFSTGLQLGVRGFVDQEAYFGKPFVLTPDFFALLDNQRPSIRWWPRALVVTEANNGRIGWSADASR
jgi:hypothetical protein